MPVPIKDRMGEVVLGKYRLDRILGEGAMGLVVAAKHTELPVKVAFKFLRTEVLGREEIVGRFAREARAAATLESDHVARVSDVGTLEDGTPFMLMEYLEGGDLSMFREKRQLLPVEQAVSYILQACEAVGEAHSKGIVHRDIKPANLFLAKRPDGKTRVKVLDFGISKVSDPESAKGAATSMFTIMGSPEYMAPEQMRSTRDVDGRADIWALGVTLYELLTLRGPFSGDSMPEICGLVMTHNPPPPSQLRPGLPPALDLVVMKAMEKDWRNRYATIAEFAAALQPFAGASPYDPRASAPSGFAGVGSFPASSGPMSPPFGAAGAQSGVAPMVSMGGATDIAPAQMSAQFSQQLTQQAAPSTLASVAVASAPAGVAPFPTAVAPAKKSGAGAIIAAVAITAVVTVGGMLGWRAYRKSQREEQAQDSAAPADTTQTQESSEVINVLPSSTPTASPPSPPPTVAQPTTPAPTTPPAPSTPATPSTVPTQPQPQPTHTTPVPAPSHAPSAPTTVPSHTPRPRDCDPPWVMDSKGKKHEKSGCPR